MKARLIVMVALLAALGACAQLNGAMHGYAKYRTEAHHTALKVALYRMCDSASVDSIEDFFDTPELMSARNTICAEYTAPPKGNLLPGEPADPANG